MRSSLSIVALMIAIALGSGCVRNWTKGEPQRVCQVHRVPLEKEVVQLGYGRPPRLSDEYVEAERRSFPHSVLYANGGCAINPFYRRAKVWLCPKCNAAEQEWLETHFKYQYEVDRAAEQLATGPSDE